MKTKLKIELACNFFFFFNELIFFISNLSFKRFNSLPSTNYWKTITNKFYFNRSFFCKDMKRIRFLIFKLKFNEHEIGFHQENLHYSDFELHTNYLLLQWIASSTSCLQQTFLMRLNSILKLGFSLQRSLKRIKFLILNEHEISQLRKKLSVFFLSFFFVFLSFFLRLYF